MNINQTISISSSLKLYSRASLMSFAFCSTSYVVGRVMPCNITVSFHLENSESLKSLFDTNSSRYTRSAFPYLSKHTTASNNSSEGQFHSIYQYHIKMNKLCIHKSYWSVCTLVFTHQMIMGPDL